MTIVREEENGNNGYLAGGVWRGGRCPSSLDTRAGALARFGRIDDATFGEEMSNRPRSYRRLRLLSQRTPSRGDGSGNRMLLIR